MNTLSLSFCLLLLAAQAAVAPDMQAQQGPPGSPDASGTEVVGVSYILPISGGTVTTYEATELGDEVAAFYDAEVISSLLQNGNVVVSPEIAEGNSIAEGSLPPVTASAGTFELDSSHWLLPFSQDFDTGLWEDPCGFAPGAGGFSTFTGAGWLELQANECSEETPNYEGDDILYVGSTSWQAYGTPPQINGISATNGPVLNSQGTMSIVGLYLTAGGTDLYPSVSVVSGSGLTLGSVQVVSDGQLNVQYSIDGNGSSSGAHGITVTTTAGPSNAGTITVGDPTPVITGIAPNAWNAGVVTTFTVSGTGFGTNPALAVTGSGVSSYGIIGTSSDTMITATVTIDGSAGGGTTAVTVQSRGYNSSGFLPAQQGQSSIAGCQATQNCPVIFPIAALPPSIMFGTNPNGTLCSTGTSVAGSLENVVVGQQIAFTGCLPNLGLGAQVVSVSWSPVFPAGTAVGGYNVAADSSGATVVQLSSPVCGTTLDHHCDFPSFYWVDQGNARQFTFSYTLSNGRSASSTLTFGVTGPVASGAGGAFFTAVPTGAASIRPTATPSLVLGANYTPYLVPGIGFSASANVAGLNAGRNATLMWVQFISKAQKNERTPTGTKVCVPNGFAAGQPHNAIPELDAYYPYPINPLDPANTNDSPSAALSSTAGNLNELATYFSATMYLFWDPALPSGCMPALTDATNNNASTSSTCTQSIPIPLASVLWSFAADTINTLVPQSAGLPSNGTTWVLGCDGVAQAGACVAAVPSRDPNESFPIWYATAANGPRSVTNTCTNN